MENMSISDIAAVMGKDKGGFLEGDSLIILILFFLIFGGFGRGANQNTDYATNQSVYDATNIQSNNMKFDSIIAGINQTNLANAQNTAAINQTLNMGFDGVNANLNLMNQGLSHQISDCCCSMKQMLLENRIADMQNQLTQAQIVASNQTQSQYILSQLGKFVPTTYTALGTTIV